MDMLVTTAERTAVCVPNRKITSFVIFVGVRRDIGFATHAARKAIDAYSRGSSKELPACR